MNNFGIRLSSNSSHSIQLWYHNILCIKCNFLNHVLLPWQTGIAGVKRRIGRSDFPLHPVIVGWFFAVLIKVTLVGLDTEVDVC